MAMRESNSMNLEGLTAAAFIAQHDAPIRAVMRALRAIVRAELAACVNTHE